MTGADKPVNSKINIECASKLIAHSSSSAVLSVVPVKNCSELVLLLLLIWTLCLCLCTFTEVCKQLLLQIFRSMDLQDHHVFIVYFTNILGPDFRRVTLCPNWVAQYHLPLLFFCMVILSLLLHQSSPCRPPLNFLVLDPNTASK